jgi:hypothetical protein
MAKLLLRPERSGYSVTPGEEVLRVKLDGGASRTRLDIIGAAHTVNVSWRCSELAYRYLMAFYRKHKANAFEIDLILDEPEYKTYEAKFNAPVQLDSQYGLTYICSTSLEIVKPYNEDEAADDDNIIQDFETAYPTGL